MAAPQKEQPESSQTNQIREAISKLAIDVPEKEIYNPYRENDYLVPQWKDITTLLDNASNDLDVGQLVHLQSFTLFDAMSAIEIMDPKMDTGMILEGDKKKPFDPLKSLSGEQVLWVIDRLLSCEMAWLSGHSLSQTIFTCMYFHDVFSLVQEKIEPSQRIDQPPELVSSVLKAYVLATTKCCHLIWREMVSGNVYEEEDFTTNLFGLSLGEHYPDTEVLNAIDYAIHWLSEFKKRMASEGGENLAVFEGLLNRLYARKHYLLAHMYFSQPKCEWYHKADSELQELTKLLTSKDAGSILNTQNLGKEVDGAFDENINRILTSQTPPRPIILPTQAEALESFVHLSSRLTSLCSIVDYQSVASLLNFCKYFASSRPYPDAFSRSKLNTSIYHSYRFLGSCPLDEVVAESMIDLLQPPSWWFSKHRPQSIEEESYRETKTAINAFLERAGLPFLDIFRIYCHNRARQRRIMCKVLGEWEILLNEAFTLDEKLNEICFDESKYYFYHWTNHRRLNMIETILLLGFELELYGSHEYTMIYWFVDYLLTYRHNVYSHIQANIAISDVYSEPYTSSNARQSSPTSQKRQRICEFQSLQLINSIKYDLNISVWRTLIAFEKINLIKKPSLAFDDEETRYQHRFKAFANLWNFELPPYERFRNDVNVASEKPMDQLHAAQMSLNRAKDNLRRIIPESALQTKTELCADSYKKDVQAMMRTCISNQVAITRIMKNTSAKINISFEYHPYWPTFNVIEL
ncbi:hypothetical protein K450DRAFT_260574 [Umbelopsis ramanniana AG]|uniref:Mak10-domain-containing protein n=1 Tax=Umbelopsis ramanniana AG TaxID=1314678 RepID=A0AAD5E1T0_UMBRA|nr:uncharacterized protein K450DRAFT_260574 [Umbelopsis ramanniana AG]KAI8575663.1 hypothetical protein K450DRAFT_260574 [Umbelopsis ramanniana AG]